MEISTLTTINGMDSRDIASLTGKDHAHVCRDIRTMFASMQKSTNPDLDRSIGEEPYHRGDRTQYKYLKTSTIETLIGGKPYFVATEENCRSTYLAGNGENRTCYILPKRECLILASGYNVNLRAVIIDRWIELESSNYIPKTLSQALRLAADQAETIEKQALLIESQRPAVEFVERFVEAKQTQPLRAVAKVLGIKEKVFVSALLEKGILYRLSGKLTPKAEMIDKGFFEVKELVTANGYATTQMRFTTDGIEWIARKVQEWGIDA